MDRYGDYTINGVPASGVLLQLPGHVTTPVLDVPEQYLSDVSRWREHQQVVVSGPMDRHGRIEETTIRATFSGYRYAAGGLLCQLVVPGAAAIARTPEQ